MTIKEAALQGISKLRKNEWEPSAFLSINIIPGRAYGPWAHIKDVSGEIDVPVWEIQDSDFIPFSK